MLYTLGVLKARPSLTGQRKLKTFLGGRATVLMLCSNSILLIQLKVGPVRKKGYGRWIPLGMSSF